ncbi:MAG: hypothetical protein WB767_07670, partial [Nocardioides sp.]
NRRRALTGAGALATAVVLGGVALVSTDSDDGRGPGRGLDPATAAYLDEGAFATGSTIHLPGDRAVELAEKVKVLYYTSAGLLARTGDTPWTDDPGPSHYTLVRPDGTQSTLDLDLGDRVPATDPDQAVLTYAEAGAARDQWHVVVLDVTSGEELTSVPVEGSFTWGGWEAPPVELDGDVVYVGLDDGTLAVDWKAGSVSPTDLDASSTPDVAGGFIVESDRTEVRVVDLATGATIYATSTERFPYIDLSPDGRFAKVVFQDEMEGESFEVVNLESGDATTIEGAAWDYGWTPAGQLLRVDIETATVTTCDALGGDCNAAAFTGATKGELKLAGLAYES